MIFKVFKSATKISTSSKQTKGKKFKVFHCRLLASVSVTVADPQLTEEDK